MSMLRSIVLVLVLAGAYGCATSESDSHGDATARADNGGPVDVARATQNQIAKLQYDMLAETVGVLQGVSDAASAKAAAPKLEQIAERLKPVIDRRAELAASGTIADDKLAFATDAMGMLGQARQVSDQLTRLEGVPGVRDAIEEPIQRILDAFESK